MLQCTGIMIRRALSTIGLLAVVVVPCTAMNKADLIAEISKDEGLDLNRGEAKAALEFVLASSTASQTTDGNSAMVGLRSFSISGPHKSSKKKPKEIVVVGSKLDEDCNLQVKMEIPLAPLAPRHPDFLWAPTLSNWPVEVAMKVRASIKKRDMEANSECSIRKVSLMEEVHFHLFLPSATALSGALRSRPQIGDEVLTMTLELPASAVVEQDEGSPDSNFDANIDNFSLLLPNSTSQTSANDLCLGAVTAAELGIRDERLKCNTRTCADELNSIVGGLEESLGLDRPKALRLLQIIRSNLIPELVEGGGSINGFGPLSLTKRAARKVRNSQTGETIQIVEAKNVIRFKAGSEFVVF